MVSTVCDNARRYIVLYGIVFSFIISHSRQNTAVNKSWMRWGEIKVYEDEGMQSMVGRFSAVFKNLQEDLWTSYINAGKLLHWLQACWPWTRRAWSYR